MVTIVIPTFNRAGVLSGTLDSVLAQTFQDWECLVVDDFSTDQTAQVVEEYHKRDDRLQYLVNERRKGAQGARNTGLNHSQGEWVLFFDSDDIMHNDMLSAFLGSVEETEGQYDVYTCFLNIFDETTKQIKGKYEWVCEGDIHQQLLRGETYANFDNSVIRKQILIDNGGLDEDFPSMQEWDTHIRLSKKARYHTIREVLADYFVGGEDTISVDTKRDILGNILILTKHKAEWKDCPSSYLKYGEMVLANLEKQDDGAFRKKYKRQIFKLMPQLRWNVFCVKTKATFRKIRHRMAKTIKMFIKR